MKIGVVGDLRVTYYEGGRWYWICVCGKKGDSNADKLKRKIRCGRSCAHQFVGKKYNMLTVVDARLEEVRPNTKLLTFECMCDCGASTVKLASNVKGGTTKSCGCVRVGHFKTHGGTGSRLHECWLSMRKRTSARGGTCFVYEPWGDYTIFEKWSLENGYNDDKVLCRNGDSGGYTPTNCRWDTQRSNAEERHAKTYMMLLFGKPIAIYNMSKYCREHGLDRSSMADVRFGRRREYKGYTTQ